MKRALCSPRLTPVGNFGSSLFDVPRRRFCLIDQAGVIMYKVYASIVRRFLGPAGELYRLLKNWESIPVTLLVKAEYTEFVSHVLFCCCRLGCIFGFRRSCQPASFCRV